MEKIRDRAFGIARETALTLGVAVTLALTVGAASAAFGANGKPFLLGKVNVARAVSALVKQGPGAALSLKVGAGQPPLAVNSSTKVANLNADGLDGKSSEAFLGVGGKASDADRLDGRDSGAFMPGEIYTVSATSEEIQPGSGRGAQALCDAGDTALSGGYRDINANLKVYTDLRVAENTDPERGPVHPSGWVAAGLNPLDGGTSGLLEVQVYCADLPPTRG